MKRIALSLALLLAASTATRARAESLESMFTEANAAYFRGDFAKAAAGYEALERAGVRDPDVIAAVDAAGAAMIFTGARHFRH